MELAKKLVKARGDRSRNEVCAIVGISLSALAMYESGQRVPRDEIKVKLARLYGVSVGDLFFNAE